MRFISFSAPLPTVLFFTWPAADVLPLVKVHESTLPDPVRRVMQGRACAGGGSSTCATYPLSPSDAGWGLSQPVTGSPTGMAEPSARPVAVSGSSRILRGTIRGASVHPGLACGTHPAVVGTILNVRAGWPAVSDRLPAAIARFRVVAASIQRTTEAIPVATDHFRVATDCFQTATGCICVATDCIRVATDCSQTATDCFRVATEAIPIIADYFQTATNGKTGDADGI